MLQELQSYDLGYADVYIFQNYLINQIKEGMKVYQEHIKVLGKMIRENFKDRKMVYISNRVHSNSVDPLVYPEVARIKNLIGIAIVTDVVDHECNARFEKIFYRRDFGIFKTFDESII